MDLINCSAYVGLVSSTRCYGNCGFGEAKVRHNFLRIKDRSSDYIPK